MPIPSTTSDTEYSKGSSTSSTEETANEQTIQVEEVYTQEEQESRYSTGKPRRIIIRARITHNES
jgi:hypothetical protein